MGLFGRKRDEQQGTPGLRGIDLGALVQQALSATQQVGGFATTGMPVAGPTTNLVKRTSCPACGAPKQLPSRSAYLYCDFCGRLVDWDLRRACEDPASARPGPAYEALVRQAAPALQQAKASGDRDAYRAVQRQVFEGYVTHCPKAVPPRAWNDPTYRAGYVAYLAECSVVQDFDPVHASFAAEVQRLVAGLRWSPGFSMQVDPATFWPLLDTVLAQFAHGQRLLDAAGTHALDPDASPPEVRDRIARSMLGQGWLPTLGPADAQTLIAKLGVQHEYVEAPPPADAARRRCGGCGSALVALPHATCVVCDACGRQLDLHAPEAPCAGCQTPLTFPVGVARLNCPSCQGEARRIGW